MASRGLRMDDGRTIVVIDTNGIASARGLAREVASAYLDQERVDDVVLVTSELVTNALEHGTGEPASVNVSGTDEHVAVSVASSSIGPLDTDPAAAPVESTRGRGLVIVAALSDAIAVSDETGTVRITCLFTV